MPEYQAHRAVHVHEVVRVRQVQAAEAEAEASGSEAAVTGHSRWRDIRSTRLAGARDRYVTRSLAPLAAYRFLTGEAGLDDARARRVLAVAREHGTSSEPAGSGILTVTVTDEGYQVSLPRRDVRRHD